ncbi:hypothetical protein COI10_05025 [Neisseria meningitidis]|nr:hypothetical protein COI37_05410 [Neisseria meningitidis]RNJ94873.1 hypothetical protein COI32_05265 [Neisseria meningitidis]RNK07922.1 hypothetical protein COI27_06225 [Neisseria meningitidis]RNK21485.1 hypothetical protein COI21_05105 [Neisseria meningitidis]RNK26613.1 hypothetical protein COH95_03875 [Neisseria meningitidis]
MSIRTIRAFSAVKNGFSASSHNDKLRLFLRILQVLAKVSVATRMSYFFRRISVRYHSVSGFPVLKNSSEKRKRGYS